MLLSREDADLFMNLHSALMQFVNAQLKVVEGFDSARLLSSLASHKRA